jgi:hypothetical protein
MGDGSGIAGVTLICIAGAIFCLIYVASVGLHDTVMVDTQGQVQKPLLESGQCALIDKDTFVTSSCVLRCVDGCEESSTFVPCQEMLTNMTAGLCTDGYYCCNYGYDICTDPDGVRYKCNYRCVSSASHRACNTLCGISTNITSTYQAQKDGRSATFTITTYFDVGRDVKQPASSLPCFFGLNQGSVFIVSQEQMYVTGTGTVQVKKSEVSGLNVFLLILGICCAITGLITGALTMFGYAGH